MNGANWSAPFYAQNIDHNLLTCLFRIVDRF